MGENTDKERKEAKMALLYKLRLKIDGEDKKEYTKEELVELLDNIGRAL